MDINVTFVLSVDSSSQLLINSGWQWEQISEFLRNNLRIDVYSLSSLGFTMNSRSRKTVAETLFIDEGDQILLSYKTLDG